MTITARVTPKSHRGHSQIYKWQTGYRPLVCIHPAINNPETAMMTFASSERRGHEILVALPRHDILDLAMKYFTREELMAELGKRWEDTRNDVEIRDRVLGAQRREIKKLQQQVNDIAKRRAAGI